MLFVGFYFVPNLIVILFNLMYLVFVVGIYCKGVWLRECEDSSNWSKEGFRGYLATKHPAKRCMCPAHDWNVKSQYRWRQLCLASISLVRPSHETPVRHSVLPDCTIWYILFAPTLYIPTLSTNEKESPWEKTLTSIGSYSINSIKISCVQCYERKDQ